jgi:hypothetical protein
MSNKPQGPSKTVLKIGQSFNHPAKGDLVVMTIRKTRWERFVNLILLPWRYVWHGRFKL